MGSSGLTGALIVIAAVLAGCGAGQDQVAGGTSQLQATTVASATAVPSATTTTGATIPPGTAVSRPGPPAVGVCSVVLDRAATADGASQPLLIRSGVPNDRFLARVTDISGSSTESGTTDGSGVGVVRIPAVPGRAMQVEVSVAGGAEMCSIALPAP